MKAAISVFAALLIAAVSTYAGDMKIQRPTKATNGANDTQVTVIKEDKKSSGKITIADLKDFSVKSFDDRVVQFRRGNELITMMPLMDYQYDAERRAAFEEAQVLAEKLTRVWLEKAFNLRFGGNEKAIHDELKSLTAAEIRKKIENNTMPTRAEIIAAASDAREAAKKLQAKAKFLVEYDELISSFDKYQDDMVSNQSFVREKLMPSAFMFVTSFRLPANVLDVLKKTRYLAPLGQILKASMTLSITVRPWKVVKTNQDTGATSTAMYYETATQGWVMKDFKSDKLAEKGPFRIGAGLLLGNFNRMANVHGGVVGGSLSFNFKKSIGDGALMIPTHTNVKMGVIGGLVELGETQDLRDTMKHGYFILTKQFGFQTPTGRTANGDIGIMANFNALAQRFGSFDKKVFDSIIDSALLDTPGTQVVIGKDQVEILVPQQTTEEKQENPAKTDDQKPVLGQDNVPSRR